jgi:hypothetical protein
MSFVETVASIAIGFVVSLCAQLWIFPHFGIVVTMQENLQIVGFFTITSVIRSYFVRRFFNSIRTKT